MLPAPWTSTGTSDRPVVVLMPSLPKPPVPHVHTVPSDLRIIVPRAPPQRETTSAQNPAIGITIIIPTTAWRRYFIIPGKFSISFSHPLVQRMCRGNAIGGTAGSLIEHLSHCNLPPRIRQKSQFSAILANEKRRL